MSKSLQRQLIEGARDLLSDPEHWTRESFAADVYDNPLWSLGETLGNYGESAFAYCAIGAVRHVAHELKIPDQAVYALEGQMADAINPKWREEYWDPDEELVTWAYETVAQMNDNSKHSEVMAYFDKLLEEVI